MKKFLRNNYRGFVHLEKKVLLRPAGKEGDAVPFDSKYENDLHVQKLLARGIVSVVELDETGLGREISESLKANDGAVEVIKISAQKVVVTKCLGITKKGTQCQTDVTYRGIQRPPLCKNHADQIDQIAWDEKTQSWARKT